jgi:hypothetical protein
VLSAWWETSEREIHPVSATRPDNSGPATRKHRNGLAVATLVFGIVGLLLGALSPPALLLGLVAVILGAGILGQGRERPGPVGLGMIVAGLPSTALARPGWTVGSHLLTAGCRFEQHPLTPEAVTGHRGQGCHQRRRQ